MNLQFRAGGHPTVWYSDVGQDEVDYMTGLVARCEAQGYSEWNAARVNVYRQRKGQSLQLGSQKAS
jgi:hypothetical protein